MCTNFMFSAELNQLVYQKVTVEEQHDASLPSGKDEKKQKNELSPGSRNHRPSSKNSKGSDASKDDYIHVRARRGQATNSHSLAERVGFRIAHHFYASCSEFL